MTPTEERKRELDSIYRWYQMPQAKRDAARRRAAAKYPALRRHFPSDDYNRPDGDIPDAKHK